MNILIPLGTGSNWQDNELRYCIRSIQKHLKKFNHIVIIGHKPKWLKPDESLVYVPFPEIASSRNKEKNIHRKILHAINSGFMKGNFLFMNDDHFLLKDFEADEFPFHHKGPMKANSLPSGNTYRRTIENTIEFLRKRWVLNPLNYDTHCPIVYNSELYLKYLGRVEFPAFGYCIKSMYANQARLIGGYYPDLKLGRLEDGWQDQLKDRLYFSIAVKSCGDELERYLQSIYPDKSPWE